MDFPTGSFGWTNFGPAHFPKNKLMTEQPDSRFERVRTWLDEVGASHGLCATSFLTPASADASFRRYFRATAADGRTFIVMDAPPEREGLDAFVRVTGLMQEAGLHAPEILAQNEAEGYLLLSDLGRQTYLDALTEENAHELMDDATTALVAWQKISRPDVLPLYDRAVLLREVNLFPEWYVGRHKGKTFTKEEQRWWNMAIEAVIANNLKESRVFVHRDFMPRNLMVSEPNPGILDYQDALYGPVSYDIACLLRDAFISWDERFVLDTTIRYWEKARKAGIPVPSDFASFYRDVEFMGVQRHLKVLGIFARIRYRDGKPKYLEDAPRFLKYLRDASNRYLELSPLKHLLDRIEETSDQVGYTF